MSLVGGTVAVAVDTSGNPQLTGAGLAVVWARATIEAALAKLPPLPVVGDTSAPYRPERPVSQADRDQAIATRRVLFEDKARDAEAAANALVAYLHVNAEIRLPGVNARVAVSVGRTPSPLAPDAAIAPPTTPVLLPLVGQGLLA